MNSLDKSSPVEQGPFPVVNVEELPPGTAQLHSKTHSDDGEGITLVPTPSGDPNDPLSWPLWRKGLNFGLLSATTMAIFTGQSIQHIFWAPLSKDLNAGFTDLTRAHSAQLGADAIACVLFIPFATKFGRRPVYLVSTALFTAAVWWSAYMQSIPELYLSNILKGIAGAVNETTVQMSIRDMFFVHRRGTANALYLAALKFGISLSPIAAGEQATISGWRSSYITLASIMTGVTFLFAATFEETKFVRPESPGEKDNDASAQSADESASNNGSVLVENARPKGKCRYPRDFRLQVVTPTPESIWKIMVYPFRVWWMPHILGAATIYGTCLAFIIIVSSMKAVIFPADPYNFNPKQLGYLHLAPFVGSILGISYGGYLVDKFVVWLSKRNKGIYEPEMRLYLIPLPALVMAGGLAEFGITASRGLPWIYPCIGSAMTSFGFGAISDMALTLVVDSYPNITSYAFVAVAVVRNTLGMIGQFALSPWRKAMGVQAMFILVAGLSLVFNSLALPLAIWGKKGRIATAARYHRLSNVKP
ncbi:hypothetical protein HIM_06643 [Hirsutella minnesotensis 3608]|uniref:Major facilitator superfamily (MFS) profile domain-containing protein n=1 Tax=Hirsutella minnesotensis 3608 TaxID=1043627 RepID=A0A0F7ZNL8_9HYPO|nr:hypothetical protein HIM_06643 [Hirsutella minnesotensis 3608]